MPPTNIRIKTLKDGVGKQAPSKRLPSEAEELINTVITVERSAEKRPGTFVVPCYETNGTTKTQYGSLDLPNSDLYFYLYEFSPTIKYLIVVDYGGTGDLLYVYQIDTTNRSNPGFKKVAQIAGTQDQKDYVRHNNATKQSEDVLEVSAIGASLLILNKTVYTGFTSGSTGKTFDFDGQPTTTNDDIGVEARYLSASNTDPEGLATIYVANKAYLADQRVYDPSGTYVFRCKQDVTAANNDALSNTTYWEQTTVEIRQIPVEDFIYADPSKAYLGQSLNDASDLNLPPKNDDHLAANGQETLLAALYPNELGVGTGGAGTTAIPNRAVGDEGKGKIYYLANSYGEFESGYYIVRSVVDKPYLLKIRTPDAYSVIDNNRMPLVLLPSNEGATWTLEKGDYNVRTSGTKELNPGPSIWENGRQVPLSSVAIFRNRLWFGAADTVFSSAIDDYGNFFIENPLLLVDSDPIDVRLSSNKYSPVSSITPFESFLFVNTTADQQFTLQGSDNQITPYTAELGSASFFSTAPLVKPILMGSQVYFFDANRVYVFLGSRAVNVQRSVEVSKGVPNYLPSQWGAIGVNNAYDTMFMVDKEDKKTVYGYTNRYQGDQIIQNAFFKNKYPWEVEAIYSQEEYIYFIAKNDNNKYYLVSQRFREDEPEAIYLDNISYLVTDGVNAVYDAASNTTTLTFDGVDDIDNNELLFGWTDLQDPRSGTILTIKTIDRTSTPGTTLVSCTGNVADVGNTIYFGKNYKMEIVLNPQYQRDQQNNVIDGVLSLRNMHCRFFNTGPFRVEKTIRGRSSVTTEYSPFELDLTLGLDVLPLENVFPSGQTVSKIFGFSDETSISIVSDTPNPVNISQIEIKGIFTPKYSSFVR